MNVRHGCLLSNSIRCCSAMFRVFVLFFFAASAANALEMPVGGFAPPPPCKVCDWTDARTLDVQGRAEFPSFGQRDKYFDRLPGDAQGKVRDEVWSLSRMSAGMYIDFSTSSSQLYLNITYTTETMSMWHFPATGCSGMDLYAWDSRNGTWRWTSVTKIMQYPTSVNKMTTLPSRDSPTRYRLHLPTYNGVRTLLIGHDEKHPVVASAPNSASTKKPIVWYGTSILQGAVASRPGMIFTSWISRNIQREIFNFGFSGNGLMELNVSQFLTDIDAALFIIDCLPNMTPDLVKANTIPIVEYLRQKHPTTPILLVSGTWYGDHWFDSSPNDAKTQALQTEYDKLVAAGRAKNVHLFTNLMDQLFGGEELINPTVGGTHPSDLGHSYMTKFYSKYLPTLLGGD